jgi:hypothetical protein
MALPNNASEYNLIMSLKKYFKDALPSLTIKSGQTAVYMTTATTKWMSIVLGNQVVDTVTDAMLNLYICTRKDNEGIELSNLRDDVVDLINTSGGKRHITFYNVSADRTSFTPIGALVINNKFNISEELTTMDNTRYRLITVMLKWVSNV